MTTHLPTRYTAVAIGVAILLTAALARTSAQEPSIAGTWNVSMIGDHVVPVALVLEQSGTKVTGTLILHGREVPVEGEYVDGALSVATAQESDGGSSPFGQITIKATLKDDGTLAGESVSSRGRIPITAERLKKRG